MSVVAPTLSTEAEARRGRGAAIGAGVALGILGAAALANSSRAYGYDGPYERRYYGYGGYGGGNQCGKWSYRCERGSGWACDKLDRYC